MQHCDKMMRPEILLSLGCVNKYKNTLLTKSRQNGVNSTSHNVGLMLGRRWPTLLNHKDVHPMLDECWASDVTVDQHSSNMLGDCLVFARFYPAWVLSVIEK